MIGDIFSHIGEVIVDFFRNEESWILLILLAGGGAAILGIPSGPEILHLIIILILTILKKTWWLWFFVILFPLFVSLWLYWRQELYKKRLSFTVLEVKVPRETLKSPQAMEQILYTFYTLRNAPSDLMSKYWKGEVTKWFSLEIVSFGGEVHFYIRMPSEYRNNIEATFFSNYPDAELAEVDDYVSRFPSTVREARLRSVNIWGTEFILTKEEGYPIKTYTHFENQSEEKQFDPISGFLEVLSKVKPEEIISTQIIIAAGDPKWGEKYAHIISDLRKAPTTTVESTGPEGGKKEVPLPRSRGQTEALEAVEGNISKPAFDTLIRVLYLAPQEIFSDSYARSALLGAFNQYSSLNLNGFKQNSDASSKTGGWSWPHASKTKRNMYREQRMLYNYRKREIPPETFMGKLITSYPANLNFASKRFKMNTEGIATLFHLPTVSVLTAPHMIRVESRKTGPPAGLAIYGDEKELERFL